MTRKPQGRAGMDRQFARQAVRSCCYLVWALTSVSLAADPAAGDTPAGQILQRVVSTYTQLDSFHFDATEVTITRAGEAERRTTARVMAAQDNDRRSHVEVDDPLLGGTAVFDGETTWVYLPRTRQYVARRAASLEGEAALPAGADYFDRIKDQFSERYRLIGDRVQTARLVRQEDVPLAGEAVPCVLIEVTYEPAPGVAEGEILRLFWIDPEHARVLREVSRAVLHPPGRKTAVEITQEFTFHIARVESPLADDLFSFAPPADAARVEQFDVENAADTRLVGTDAPDFTLRSLDGEDFRLAEQRGKIVLLDFWASWCMPCRVELPRLDALYREQSSRRLVVVGVNGEEPSRADAFLRQMDYRFPTLTDAQEQVARLYFVAAIPTTVIIDREGRVSSYLEGARSEHELRDALQRAGLTLE